MLLAMMSRPGLALLLLLLGSFVSTATPPDGVPASSAAAVDAAPPPQLCPVTTDPLLSPLGWPLAIAGNGSGFLLLSPSLVQSLDAEGRPSAEARARNGFITDLDWAGDRYMGIAGSFMAAFAPTGEEILPRIALPVSGAEGAWNGSRGLVIGQGIGGPSPYPLYAVPVQSDGSVGEPLFLGNSSAASVAIEPFGDGFLAVYVLDQINVVAALRFDADGKPVGDVQQIATVLDADNVTIAVHPAGAIVTFESYLNLLTAIPIRPDGTPGPAGFSLDLIQAYALTPTPSGALLYVNSGRGEPSEDRLYTLDADARVVSERASERMVGGTLVRRGEGGLLLVTSGSQSRITSLDFAGNPIAPPHAAVLAPADQSNVRVSTDGVRFVSAWITRTAEGDRIEAAVMNASGENRSCSVVAAGTIGVMALAGSPAGFLLVWNEGHEFRASLLAGDSWVRLPLDLPDSGAVLAADLTWDGTAFRFAWEHNAWIPGWPTGSEARTVRITPGGSDSEWRATVGAEDPHVATIGDRTLLLVRRKTRSREMELPDRRWTAFGEAAIPPLDIASNGAGAMAVVSDGHTLETIAIDTTGMPTIRRELARGSKIAAASVASRGDGYVVSWIARDDRPRWGSYTIRWLTFIAEVDASGARVGPLRVEATGWRNPPLGGDFDLAATPYDAIAVWAARIGGDAISTRLESYRALAAPASTADLHEGTVAPPASVSIRKFQSPADPAFYPKRVELTWTPVAGADAYVIQASYLDPGRWETFAVLPGDAFRWEWTPDLRRINYRNPTHFRVASLKNGLASEWVEVSLRGRLVNR
jgi:hypothetical protein